MHRTLLRPLMGFALVLFLLGFTGCDTFEGVFGGDQETTGTVEQVGTNYLVVDAIRYAVTPQTEFDGYARLADVSVGDRVKVEYEDRSGERFALEIEDPSAGND